MAYKIMVLFDSPFIRTEAVQYSMELAKRMDAALVLVVLLPFEMPEKTSDEIEAILQLGTRAKEALKQHIKLIENAGIPVEAAVRIGNPRSELVKFMAESERFQTIVWGGKSNPIDKKNHWMANLKDVVKCTVLVPCVKTKAKV